MLMENMRQTWIKISCFVFKDGSTDIQQQTLINIIVTCIVGSYFLRAINCSRYTIYLQIFKETTKDIRYSNVVQLVTDSSHNCKLANLMVESANKYIFWIPCCLHALKDIKKID